MNIEALHHKQQKKFALNAFKMVSCSIAIEAPLHKQQTKSVFNALDMISQRHKTQPRKSAL
jgi:hypothetical protein